MSSRATTAPKRRMVFVFMIAGFRQAACRRRVGDGRENGIRSKQYEKRAGLMVSRYA